MYFISPKPEDKFITSSVFTVGCDVSLYKSLVNLYFSNVFDEKSICSNCVSAASV